MDQFIVLGSLAGLVLLKVAFFLWLSLFIPYERRLRFIGAIAITGSGLMLFLLPDLIGLFNKLVGPQ